MPINSKKYLKRKINFRVKINEINVLIFSKQKYFTCAKKSRMFFNGPKGPKDPKGPKCNGSYSSKWNDIHIIHCSVHQNDVLYTFYRLY